MEVVGLTVGLISLFSICVECFEYFEAARDFPVYYKQLLTKLELQKIRLLAWGDAVGVLGADNNERLLQIRDIPVIEKTLQHIKDLLLNANNLQHKYGVTTITEKASEDTSFDLSQQTGIVQATALVKKRNTLSVHSRFWKKYSRNPRPRPLAKVIWAIQDKTKFETLIATLTGFIDDLNELKELIRADMVQVQNDMIRMDIESIPSGSLPNLDDLRIIEACCSEIYPDWAEAARSQIATSEFATRDDDYIHKWNLGVLEDETPAEPPVTPSATGDLLKFNAKDSSARYRQLYFMLTGPCLRNDPSQPCDIDDLFLDTKPKACHSVETETHNSANVAQRIYSAFEAALMRNRAISRDDRQQISHSPLYVVIYCAPCLCLILTALNISTSPFWDKLDNMTTMNRRIRVDPRLSVDCCSSLPLGLEKIKAMQAGCDNWIRKGDNLELFGAIDHAWVDETAFAAEQKEPSMLSQANSSTAQQLLLDHYNSATGDWDNATVILGDVNCLVLFMDSLNCVPNPMVPTVGQIWQVYQEDSAQSGSRWVRRAWQRYVLSNEAFKQQKELADRKRLSETTSQTGTETSRSSSRPASTPASPLSSVGSKWRRTIDEDDQRRKKPSVEGTHEDSF